MSAQVVPDAEVVAYIGEGQAAAKPSKRQEFVDPKARVLLAPRLTIDSSAIKGADITKAVKAVAASQGIPEPSVQDYVGYAVNLRNHRPQAFVMDTAGNRRQLKNSTLWEKPSALWRAKAYELIARTDRQTFLNETLKWETMKDIPELVRTVVVDGVEHTIPVTPGDRWHALVPDAAKDGPKTKAAPVTNGAAPSGNGTVAAAAPQPEFPLDFEEMCAWLHTTNPATARRAAQPPPAKRAAEPPAQPAKRVKMEPREALRSAAQQFAAGAWNAPAAAAALAAPAGNLVKALTALVGAQPTLDFMVAACELIAAAREEAPVDEDGLPIEVPDGVGPALSVAAAAWYGKVRAAEDKKAKVEAVLGGLHDAAAARAWMGEARGGLLRAVYEAAKN